MSRRSTAGVLNAIIWGSGYLYSHRGKTGILAVLAHLSLYLWIYLLGLSAWLLWGPILLLGSLYFAIDGYKFARETSLQGPSSKGQHTSSGGGKKFCRECGADVSKAKFCPECGARQ